MSVAQTGKGIRIYLTRSYLLLKEELYIKLE